MASNYVDRTIKIPASQPTATLDPDKFLGTIGLNADREAKTTITNYTAFPKTADKGNWLRSISETKIGDRQLLSDQEWICVASGTEQNPAIWEVIQIGTKKQKYLTYSNILGECRRRNSSTNFQSIPSGATTYIDFATNERLGIFGEFRLAAYPKLIEVGPFVLDALRFDFYVRLAFSKNLTGIRTGNIGLYSYYPEGDDLTAIPLETFIIDGDTVGPRSPIKLMRSSVVMPQTEPLDDTPLYYAIAVSCFQDSGAPLDLIFAELKIMIRS